MNKTKEFARKALSIMLSLIMCFGFFAMLGDVTPKANAASAGSYYVKITWNVSTTGTFKKSYGGKSSQNNDSVGFSVIYKKNNGTDSTEVEEMKDLKSDLKSSGSKTTTFTVPGFPVEIYGYMDDNVFLGSTSTFQVSKVEIGPDANNLTTIVTTNTQLASYSGGYGFHFYQDDASIDGSDNDNYNKDYSSSGWVTPKATTTSVSGGSSSLTVPTNAGGSTSGNAYSAGTVYDQYGVAWYQDATLSANYTDKITFSSNKITVTNAKSNASADYNVTVTAKCGNASATSTCTIKTFDYIAKFYDENGTTQIGSDVSVDYGKTATAPSTPTKAYDSTNHYTFKAWSPTPAALTTGAQTVKYTATYTATAHTMTGTVVAPTCTAKGYTIEKCTCGYTYNDNETAALGHSYVGVVTTEPTCTTKGVKTYTCSRTGCTASYTEEIAALGHDYSAVLKTVAPTCLDYGYTLYKCSRCDAAQGAERDKKDALGHDYSVVKEVVAATCTTDGYTVYKCSRCDATETRDTVKATGHSWTQTGSKAATCTAQSETYYKCANCSETKTEYGDANGHSWATEYTIDTAATCETAGSKSKHCLNCSEKTDVQVIQALGHDPQRDTSRDVAATCTETGIEGYTCSRCQKQLDKTTDALGHDYADTYTVDVVATCKAKGSESRHCSRCSSTTDSREIAKTAHTWGEDRKSVV